jgi:glycosyltransferase 2 family protein
MGHEPGQREDMSKETQERGTSMSRKLMIIALGSMIAYVALALFTDAQALGAVSRAFDWWLLPLLLMLASANYLSRFLRWEFYLRRQAIRVPLFDSFTIFLAGLFMSITPGKLGELLKSFLLRRRHGVPVAESASVIIGERFTDLTSVLLLSVAGVWGLGLGLDIFLAGLALVGVFLLGVFWTPPSQFVLGLAVEAARRRGKASAMEALRAKIEVTLRQVRGILRPWPFVAGNAIGAFAWGAEAFAFYLLIDAVGGDVTLLQALFVYSVATIAGAVSMLPGGLIATEGSMLGLMMVLNMVPDNATGVFVTILIRFSTLWFAVLVGMLGFLPWMRVTREEGGLDALEQ